MAARYPLLAPAVAFACGVAVAGWIAMDGRVGFLAAAAMGIGALSGWRRRGVFGCAALFFAGAALLAVRYSPRDANDLRVVVGEKAELTRLRGRIVVEPERRVLDQDGAARHRTTARVRVAEVELDGAWRKASGDVAVSTVGFLADEFVNGAEVEVFGALSRPEGAVAPGLFDFKKYLRWQRIFYVLRVEMPEDWKLIEAGSRRGLAGLCRWFNDWGKRTLQRGLPEDENTRLLWSMALGWRAGLTEEVSDPFRKTGTLHVFAISGLHIAMMAAILIWFLRGVWIPRWVDEWVARCFPRAQLGLSRRWAGAVVIPMIWFYAAATGWQASAIRSTIMSTVVIAGWAARRPSNLLNSLAASALIILAWQPEQLFQAGFQLSFALLLTMAIWPALVAGAPWPDPTRVLGQKVVEAFERKPRKNQWTLLLARVYEWATGRDPYLPAHLRSSFHQALDGPVAWLLGGLNLSIASLVGAGMIVAVWFNLVSFSSVIANLLVVPVSGIALGGSMASLACGWLPLAPEVCNWISWSAMWLMVRICRELEMVPLSFAYFASPSAWTVVVYYLCAIGLVTGWAGRARRRLVALAVLAGVAVGAAVWNERSTTEVTMLPGAGAVFIDAPGTRGDMLVDCDRERESMMVVARFLRSRGVDKLPRILLTHGDVAHVGGYWQIEREFAPVETLTSPARSRSPKYRDILRAMDESHWREVSAGAEVAGWETLHPGAGEDFGKADDEAIVLARSMGGARVLLLSDLGRAGQRRLIERGVDLRADVVFCGASNEGTMREEFIEAMNPKVIVIAGGIEGPSRTLVEQWQRRSGTRVLASATEGAVTLRARGRSVILQTTVSRTEITLNDKDSPRRAAFGND